MTVRIDYRPHLSAELQQRLHDRGIPISDVAVFRRREDGRKNRLFAKTTYKGRKYEGSAQLPCDDAIGKIASEIAGWIELKELPRGPAA